MPDTCERSPWPEPRWLEARENPYGLRVFDCRRKALEARLARSGGEAEEAWARRRLIGGSEFGEASVPDPVVALSRLSYPLADGFPEGPLFVPACPEEVWFAYAHDGWLVFVEGLSPLPAFRARWRQEGQEAVVCLVEAEHERVAGDATLALRAVDFLIKRLVLRLPVPHPLPATLPDDAEAILLYSFFEYGRNGLFATRADTLAHEWRRVDYREVTRFVEEGGEAGGAGATDP